MSIRSRDIKRRLGIRTPSRGGARRGTSPRRTSMSGFGRMDFAALNLPRFRLPRFRLPRFRFAGARLIPGLVPRIKGGAFGPASRPRGGSSGYTTRGRGGSKGSRRSPFAPNKRRRTSSAIRPASLRRIKERLFRLSVFFVIALIAFGAWQLLRPGIRVRANPDVVAAFRVPHRAIGLLKDYADANNIPFAQLFAVFNAENDFFPEKSAVYDLSVLESMYVEDFHRILRRYNSRSLAPYVTMFENLFGELVTFPIPPGWYQHEPSIMFGDSWGVEHNFQGNRMHMGTAVICRENVRGRVPIVSMTHGHVEEAGWNNQLGYFVGIITLSGTYYLYAHLDSLAAGLAAGQDILAGHPLGYMGNTGGGRGGRSFPVHLHIGISPQADFARGRFWINPYPLLRYLENQQ